MSSLAYKNPLAFLESMTHDRRSILSIPQLKTNFADSIWTLNINGTICTIDFDIALPDGSRLHEQNNTPLERAIKAFLAIQYSTIATKGLILSPLSHYHRIQRAIAIADMLILRSSLFDIGRHGLATLTGEDVKAMMGAFLSSSSTAEAVYGWRDKLAAFLKSSASAIEVAEYRKYENRYPGIGVVEVDQSERMLSMTDDEVIRARIWLLENDCLSVGYSLGCITSADVAKLSRLIYKDTLAGFRSRKPCPPELGFGNEEEYRRELVAVPVRRRRWEDSRPMETWQYSTVIKTLCLLPLAGEAISISATETLKAKSTFGQVAHQPGRYATVPVSTIEEALRHALEFYINYGDDLVDTYGRLADLYLACGTSRKKKTALLSSRTIMAEIAAPSLIKLGVKCWIHPAKVILHEKTALERKSDFYARLRRSESLYELITVLYGAIQIAIGVLMARRGGELIDLEVGKSLDELEQNLIFANRKSGVAGLRTTLHRPIPKLEVEMVRTLEKLHKSREKLDIGAAASVALFARPTKRGFKVSASHARYCKALDLFADYFQISVDHVGRRYYLRQHQLRRFFAMAFFYSNSHGGMDVLRWFMGHVDARHLYSYLTEEVPGAVLTGVKACYAADRVRQREQDSAALRQHLSERFGAADVHLLEFDELEAYIESMISSGQASVEPVFLDSSDGRYTVAIIVRDANA